MIDTPIHATINIYPQLDNAMQFKIDEISKIKYYFRTPIREGETTSKTHGKYIAAPNYFDKSFFVLPAASGGPSFAIVI